MIVLGFAIPVLLVVTGYSDAPNPSIFLHPQNRYSNNINLTFINETSIYLDRFPIEKVGIFIFATYNQLIPYFFGVILGLILISDKQLYIGPVS